MEPITGIALYAACAVVVAVIAGAKGLSWSAYLLLVLVLGPATVMGLSVATQGTASSVQAATLALCVPLVAVVLVLLSKNKTTKRSTSA
jgi:hypothetical protein